jgi:hypothetical protein
MEMRRQNHDELVNLTQSRRGAEQKVHGRFLPAAELSLFFFSLSQRLYGST